LHGKGLGPEATISPPNWRLNDVSVSEKQTQEIKIFNQGQIPFDFVIKPNNTAFGRLFEFSAREGHLDTVPPNNEKAIMVEFTSSKVGDFAERFEIQLGKDVVPLVFACEGKVIAPPMKFEETEMDFKVVPFGFEESREVSLINLSNVEVPFEVEIHGEGDKRAFTPENVPKSIKRKEKAKIKIKFCPPGEDLFNASLTVKVFNVAQDYATLPLKGVCQRPKVDVKPSDFLDFEQIFLRNPKVKEIVLTNTSNLRARFQVQDQDETSKRLAVYTVMPAKGEIEPNSKRELSIKLAAEMRGPVAVPLYLDLSSSVTKERIMVKADVLGPQVAVEPQVKDFKDVQVLSEVKDKVTLHNSSEIPATYTAFTREKKSIFQVYQRTGVLQRGQSSELTIVCKPDDAQNFDDVLYIDICEGLHSEVKLHARGIGTSICVTGYEKDVEEVGGKKLAVYKVPFGSQYINFEAVKTINIENRGRKKQFIKFDRYPPLPRPKQQKAKEKKDTTLSLGAAEARKQKEEEEEEVKTVFSIDPIEEEKGHGAPMKPSEAFSTNCRALCKVAQKEVIEQFKFTASFENARKDEDIFIVKFVGDFVVPHIAFSEAKLFFPYIYQGEDKREPIAKELEIACECDDATKGASFRLNVPIPFRTKGTVEKMALMPGEKQKIVIEFDPSASEGRESRLVTGNLELIYDKEKGGGGAPRLLPLEARLCYPNLVVTPTALDFGCILYDTSRKGYITLQNNSELPVNYCWEFVETVTETIQEVPEEETKKRPKRGHGHVRPKVNELYDILPISGLLQSGEMETVEVTYHAVVRELAEATARCVVAGGPDYQVTFRGESDDITESIGEQHLNFDDIAYNEESKGFFKIINSGKVAFKFFVSLEKLSRPGMIVVEPQSGMVQPSTREGLKVEVRLTPGVPDRIEETLLVYLAHKPPRELKVTAVGTFPLLIFQAQRVKHELFTSEVEQLEKMGELQSPCLIPKEDIQRLLGKKGENVGRSQISTILRPQVADLEAEVDRKCLIKLLSDVRF
jgi:hydrocephalus-inducing protein